MSERNAVVAVYGTHIEAEGAVKELQRAGIDMQTLSIVGRDSYTDEHVVGYYNAGDRMKYWGKTGAFWGGFWGLLFGSAFFAIPGIRPVLVAGPLVCLDRGSVGRRRGGRRFERHRCGALWHGYSEGQRRSVRSGAQD